MSNDRAFCLPCTCERCRRNYTDRFCSICCFESGNAFIDDLITKSFDDLPNSSDHPPQPQTHSFDSNGDPPQIPFISNPDPCYNQNFDDTFPQNSPNFQQQILCCENCRGPHESYQCQPMNQNYYDLNLCYNFNSSSFDQYQPPQYSVTHQTPMAELLLEEKLHQALQALCEKLDKNIQEKQEEKNVAEEQAAKVIAIAPDLPITDSLIMEDKHLNTIPEKESNKVIKSSVENLVPIPSESKDLTDYESECDMPVCDDSSSKNEGLDDIEFIGKLAPIDPIPPGIIEADLDPKEDIHLIEKLLNDDSSPHSLEKLNFEIPDAIIESFSPSPIPVEDSDSLMEEIDIFLAPNDSIPSGIENDDSEGDVLFLAELLNNDYISLSEYESFHIDFYNIPSSPRPPEKPPDDDVYFDIEPDTGVLTTKVVDDISDNSTSELYVHVPNVLPTIPTLYLVFDTLLPFSSENEDKVFNPGILLSNEEKSTHLLSHRGFKVF
ncbi:hypothetical protein Tco_0360315 [Tanacetum coccineum]